MAFYKTCTPAMRAGQVGAELQRRPHPLAGHLHYAKSAYSHYPCTGAVRLNGISKYSFHLLTVFLKAHINKITNYQSPEVPQSQLTGNLDGSLYITFIRSLLRAFMAAVPSAVDIYRDQRLGLLDYD